MDTGIPRTVTLEREPDTDLRDAVGVVPRVTVLEPHVTTAHTAQIRVALENQGEQSQTLAYTRETCDLNLLVGRYQHRSGTTLLLLSTEHAWERTDPECWMPDRRNLTCGIPARDHEITIAPDDPFQWTFRLWADPESDGCMPPGTCQFTRVLRHEGTEVTLSFALAIDDE